METSFCLKNGATAAFDWIIFGVDFVFGSIYKIYMGLLIPGVMHSRDGKELNGLPLLQNTASGDELSLMLPHSTFRLSVHRAVRKTDNWVNHWSHISKKYLSIHMIEKLSRESRALVNHSHMHVVLPCNFKFDVAEELSLPIACFARD